MLELRNVGFSFPQSAGRVFDHVSLTIGKGELALVKGGNGSGKSTFLAAAAGVVPYITKGRFEGSVLIGGKKCVSFDDFISRVAYFSQDATDALVSSDVREEMRFGEWMNAASAKDTAYWSSFFGVDKLPEHSFTLSAGERQRLVLASLFALNRPVLILDEPLSALDGFWKSKLVSGIKRLLSNGTAVLVSSSSSDPVLEMLASEVIDFGGVLKKGKTKKFSFSKGSALVFDEVTYKLDGRTLFDSFSKEFGRGVHFVRGPNGCGKTTLLRLAAGLLKPTSGTVRSKGDCAFVFQNPTRQVFERTLFDEVAAGLKWRDRFSRDRVEYALNLFGFENHSLKPLSLSFGQKKRLCLASAFALDASVVLLDEPFSALDGFWQERVSKLIDSWSIDKTVLVAEVADLKGKKLVV